MVKLLFRICLSIFLIGGACSLSGCTVDLLGLFGSNDLNKRLKEKDNFTYLSRYTSALDWGDEYSFIVLADTHIQDGNALGLEGLKNVVENSLGEIKFVVIAGDITQYAKEKDVQTFIDFADSLSLDPFGVPCYPVIGNHDIYFGNWSAWKKLIGSTRYRIDADETSLFILDSATGFFGKDQIDWLERELKTTAGKRVFIFTHTNIFVDNPLEIQQLTDTAEPARVTSLLRGRCDAMFTGHLHERVIKEAGNVKYISIEDFHKQRIYCLVTVKAGGGMSYSFKKLPSP